MKSGQDKNRLLLENLPSAFAYHQIITDRDGNPVNYLFLDVNSSFYEMTGFSKDNVIGKKVTEIMPEIAEENFDWIGTYGKVALDGETIRFEQYLKTVDRWYEITAYSDEPGFFAVVFRDITEQKKAEEALQESNERFRILLERLPGGVFAHDLDGRILFVNERACKNTGYAKDELLQMPVDDIDPHTLKNDRNRLWRELNLGHSITLECMHIRKDGSQYSAEVHLTAVRLRGKNIILPIAFDITDRKQAEQNLADYTLEREQLYRQLDKELDKARQVHERALPPTLPEIEGLSFAAHYQPAQKLGGDFYDVIHKENKLIFYLSDVSGHGLDGAMLSVFVKYTIKSYISHKPTDNINPALILHHLAEQFSQENYSDELYICIFMSVLDLESMVLTYCGAGFQDAPLVQLGNRDKRKLVTQGLIITSYLPLEILKLHEKHITLTPGTTVFFNTDGLTEQGNRGLYYRDRLPNVFYGNACLPAYLISQAVNNDFQNFNDGSLQGKDDITFLVLQVDPAKQETHHLELASDFSELVRMRDHVSELLADSDEAGIFITGLHEMAANAIEHGNRLDPGKIVYVELIITEGFLQATVDDQGTGFNWREKIDKPMELDGSNDRGRGIAMTRICCGQLLYNDKGNRATVVVKTS